MLLLVGSTDDAVLALLTLPFARRRGKEGAVESLSDRRGDLRGRAARPMVERDDLFGEAARRCAEVQATLGHCAFARKKLFRSERV
jgi:hypothetical protein